MTKEIEARDILINYFHFNKGKSEISIKELKELRRKVEQKVNYQIYLNISKDPLYRSINEINSPFNWLEKDKIIKVNREKLEEICTDKDLNWEIPQKLKYKFESAFNKSHFPYETGPETLIISYFLSNPKKDEVNLEELYKIQDDITEYFDRYLHIPLHHERLQKCLYYFKHLFKEVYPEKIKVNRKNLDQFVIEHNYGETIISNMPPLMKKHYKDYFERMKEQSL